MELDAGPVVVTPWPGSSVRVAEADFVGSPWLVAVTTAGLWGRDCRRRSVPACCIDGSGEDFAAAIRYNRTPYRSATLHQKRRGAFWADGTIKEITLT